MNRSLKKPGIAVLVAAVKYSLKPSSSRQSQIPDDPGSNYLRDVIDQDCGHSTEAIQN